MRWLTCRDCNDGWVICDVCENQTHYDGGPVCWNCGGDGGWECLSCEGQGGWWEEAEDDD